MATRWNTRPLISPGQPLDLSWQISSSGTSYLGIYGASTTQEHIWGRRCITDDGRIFKYSHATTGGVDAYHACKSLAADVIGEVLTTAAAKGDVSFYITETGITEDQLVGGYVIIYDCNGVSGAAMQRYIVGNEASAASVALKTKVFVDAPFDQTVVGTEYCELFSNPYSLCTKTATGKASCISVPATTCATLYNFWGQTYGPCVISPGQTIQPSADNRNLVFGSNNAVFTGDHGCSSYATSNQYQHAGFVLNYNSDNGPLIMLQISI